MLRFFMNNFRSHVRTPLIYISISHFTGSKLFSFSPALEGSERGLRCEGGADLISTPLRPATFGHISHLFWASDFHFLTDAGIGCPGPENVCVPSSGRLENPLPPLPQTHHLNSPATSKGHFWNEVVLVLSNIVGLKRFSLQNFTFF